jgi:hypothetical protein
MHKPLKEVIQAVNRVIRGWVNNFRIGNSNHIFDKVKSFIEEEVKRFVTGRKGGSRKAHLQRLKAGSGFSYMKKQPIPSCDMFPQIRR